MPTKKADHRHKYETVLVHLTDRDPASLLCHFRMGRCTICGKFKNSVFFETVNNEDGTIHFLRPHEIIEAYKDLPQYYLKSSEVDPFK